MTLKPSGRLRAAKALGSDPEADAAGENGRVGGSFATLADLVADLIGPIEIIPRDRLAAAKARAGVGSLAEALADEGHAQPDGIARSLARRHGASVHRSPGRAPLAATRSSRSRCARSSASPRFRSRSRTAGFSSRSPTRRTSSRSTSSGSRPSTTSTSRSPGGTTSSPSSSRLERASEVYETQSALEEFEVVSEDDGDDLEADDGVSDAPLVRLVNSIIMQAASDGASDIHFEPQGDSLVVRTRVDGVLTEQQRIPKRMAAGVTTRLKVLAKLDIAERRKPQDGRISLNATRRRPAARHPRRDAADRRGRAGRDAPDRQVALDADARVARSLRDDARADLRRSSASRPARSSRPGRPDPGSRRRSTRHSRRSTGPRSTS